MSDAVNPFQSPDAQAAPEKPLVAQGTLTETMLIYLKGASPWLRFIGILGFISAGMTAIWGIASIAFVPFLNGVWDEIPGFEWLSVYMNAVFGGAVAVLCIGAGVLIFFPSLFIYRFGDKIRSFLRTGTDRELELAFKNNKSLWKFSGIVSIINLAFVPLLIIGVIIVMVVMALG